MKNKKNYKDLAKSQLAPNTINSHSKNPLSYLAPSHEVEPTKIFMYTIIFYLTFMITASLMGRGGDLKVHGNIALEYVSFRNPLLIFSRITYPAWHILTNIFYRLLGNLIYAAAFVTSCFNLFTTVVIVKLLKRFLKDKFSSNIISVITFVLSFVMGIWLPWFSPHIYFGPGSPTIWHNPTSNAVKGLSLILFFLFLDIYEDKESNARNRMTRKQFVLLTSLFFLGSFLKPTFIALFIPSAFIFLFIDLIRYKGKDIIFCAQTAFACVPALIPVYSQYMMSYGDPNGKRGGIVFSFLGIIGRRTTNVPLTLMLPFMFPCLLFLLEYRNIYKNKRLFLSLIMMVVSTVYTICWAEANNPNANELAWTRMMALIIVGWLPLSNFLIFIIKVVPEKKHASERT